jgi:phosphatidate cytidylyltransferase
LPLSNLTIRVLVAILGIPLILLLVTAGGFSFFVFVAVVSGVALHEFYGLARKKGASPQVWLGLCFGVLVNGVFIHGRITSVVLGALQERGIAIPWPSMAQVFLILFLLFVPLMLALELFRDRGSAVANLTATLFGVGYVSLFLGSLIGIRELFVPADFPVYAYFRIPGPGVPADVEATIYRWGGLTVVAVFASIWCCDSAAYFVGRALGRHKLFPRVSPHKTWEGAIAGVVCAVAAFLVARALVLPYLSAGSAVVCGLIVGVFGQLGDLAESLLKRDAGVKDSSSLIPGHGGVLDRFDSLMFVSPLIYVYLDFVVF